jgi:hypothetical protein
VERCPSSARAVLDRSLADEGVLPLEYDILDKTKHGHTIVK